MQYPYEVFLHDISLGCGTAEDYNVRAQILPPEHLAFFCPFCGDLWARCVPHGAASRWHILSAPCQLCGFGTLWLSWLPEHNRSLPREALEREFLIASVDKDEWEDGGWVLTPGGFQAGIHPELPDF